MGRIRETYPAEWKNVVAAVRTRSGGRCECCGECGLHHGRRCAELGGSNARWARGKVVLTTAHMCKCDPLCAIQAHLKGMCNRCHLRIDVDLHIARRRRNARMRAEIAGQLSLPMHVKH